jgi:hypothetical protein
MKRWLLPIAVAMSLAGCSAPADTKAAETGITDFHREMDAGQYAPIYDASASDMKSSISRDDFVKFLSGLHGKLGPYRSGKTTGWNVNYGTGGHLVTLTHEAQFERGPGTEQFIFRVSDEKASLVGYHINSNLLVTG